MTGRIRPETFLDPVTGMRTTDPVVAHNEKGYPIFGYNGEGKAICYAKKREQGGKRCGCPVLYPNGRCKTHGGVHKKGAEAGRYKTGKFSKYLQGGALEAMLEAAHDPDYRNMQDEIALNFVGITAMMERGIDAETIKKAKAKAKELEDFLFGAPFQPTKDFLERDDKRHKAITRMETLAEELSRLLVDAERSMGYQKELDDALLRRAKLIELENKRTQFEQANMPAEQVLALFRVVIDKVKKCFGNDPVGLAAFAYECDSMANLVPGGNTALQARPGVAGMIKPQSVAGDELRNAAEAEDAEFVEIEGELDEEYPDVDDPEEPEENIMELAMDFNSRRATVPKPLPVQATVTPSAPKKIILKRAS